MTDLFAAPTGPYFVYGTLTDRSLLREILGLKVEPELRSAYMVGYKCKLWGEYPALLDATGLKVEGLVYHVQMVEHGEKLAEYETSNYNADPCHIRYTDGQKPEDDYGHTFKFVGDEKDLSEGVFDLKAWLKKKKLGRHAAA